MSSDGGGGGVPSDGVVLSDSSNGSVPSGARDGDAFSGGDDGSAGDGVGGELAATAATEVETEVDGR